MPQITWLNNFSAMITVLAVAAFLTTLLFKSKRIKSLRAELDNLQRAFHELDGQAKLIVQTDLELHHAREELDKKVAGLVTLQELSRSIASTLDEKKIFNFIEQRHVTELGFDKAVILAKDNSGALQARAAIGCAPEEIQELLKEFRAQPSILEKLLDQNKIFASGDTGQPAGEVPRFQKILNVAGFICAPITQKNGAWGALLMASESPFANLTDADCDLVSILATQIGQALENAKLFEETWRGRQDLELKIQERTKELSRALEEIKIISKRKSDFISSVSHELRTPLTSIKGYASILSMGKLGELPPAAKERVEKINKHSDNLAQLINNLLDISRIESGRVELKLEPLDLTGMLDNISDMFAPAMKEKNIEWAVNLDGGQPRPRGDKNQIERVFINLIGNAVKFTPAGGRVSVHAQASGRTMIDISISDNGLGIPEKDLDKIFEEFFRVDNEINQKVKGTGLGLTLVKRIIEAHHGTLSVKSQVGLGTTFTFSLPQA